MVADAQGNDIGAVGVPITGFLGFAPRATGFLTPSAGASPTLTLPAAFKKAGLIKTDGGFEWTLEPDGDAIEFLQEGYSIPSGLANATLDVGFAQYDDTLRLIAWGKTPDANGYMTINAGGHTLGFIVFTEEIFKNGWIRRRQADVNVASAKIDKTERGNVNGTNVQFKANPVAELGYDHLGEWWIAPDGTVVPDEV